MSAPDSIETRARPPANDRAEKGRGGPRRPLGEGAKPIEEMRERPNFTLLYMMLAVFGVVTLHDLWFNYRAVERIPYSRAGAR